MTLKRHWKSNLLFNVSNVVWEESLEHGTVNAKVREYIFVGKQGEPVFGSWMNSPPGYTSSSYSESEPICRRPLSFLDGPSCSFLQYVQKHTVCIDWSIFILLTQLFIQRNDRFFKFFCLLWVKINHKDMTSGWNGVNCGIHREGHSVHALKKCSQGYFVEPREP